MKDIKETERLVHFPREDLRFVTSYSFLFLLQRSLAHTPVRGSVFRDCEGGYTRKKLRAPTTSGIYAP